MVFCFYKHHTIKMKKEDLIKLKEKLSEMTEEEQTKRDLHLRKLATGEIQGPVTQYASINKPWLKYYKENAISIELSNKNLFEYLYECNKNRLKEPALEYFGKKITYEKMFENINKTAHSLQQIGVNYGDIVTVTAAMIPEIVYLFYALNKIGAISNMIDPRSDEKLMKNYLTEGNSKFVFSLDSSYSNIINIADQTVLEKIVVLSPADSLPPVLKRVYLLKQKLNSDNIDFTQNKVMKWTSFFENIKDTEITNQFQQIATIVHTGGTTGNPKGVQLTNRNLNSLIQQSAVSGVRLEEEESWLGVIPPFVAYGSGTGMHLPLCRGMKLILVPTFGANDFDKLLAKYKPNHMSIVPSYFKSIISSKKLKKADLSYIIAPTVGGDAMDPTFENNINEFLMNHGCEYKISKGYGMTECSSGVSLTVSPECNKKGSVGIPLVKTTISIFDPETLEEMQIGEKGEICIQSPSTMYAYLNNEEESKKVLVKHPDGSTWAHSGDIGYISKDGVLFVDGRIKRMIIDHDGFKIFPSSIEDVIMNTNLVTGCAIVGIFDKINGIGELPVAFITLDEIKIKLWDEICISIKENCKKVYRNILNHVNIFYMINYQSQILVKSILKL